MTTENNNMPDDGPSSGGAKTFHVVVDGRPLTVYVIPIEAGSGDQPPTSADGSFQISVDGRDFRVRVETGGASTPVGARLEAPPATAPFLQAQAASVALSREQESAAQAPPSSATAAGETALTAPMPGTVVRYTVSEAQQVKAGETVVVLEAMKMENTLPAPVDGVVKHLPLQAGAKVARGDLLAVIGSV